MIVDIIEEPPISIGQLNSCIWQYIGANGRNPYIFMSRETANAMGSEFEFFPDKKEMRFYQGLKVFIDNTLPYNYVELR